MVCGVLGVPACGDSITGGGGRLAGGTRRVPRAGFRARFLESCFFVSARAREDRLQTLFQCGFRRYSCIVLLGHFPGLKGHSPGEWDIFRAQSTALKSYPQVSLFLGRYVFWCSRKIDWKYVG